MSLQECGITEQGDGIYTVDTGFQRPGLVASHLLVESGQAVFIDVGTSLAIPRLLAALAELGLARAAVRAVIVTHVHLDHAGGAGCLLKQLPCARLLVHPRGARHMIDPTKLIDGATKVYGVATMLSTFGAIEPVAADWVTEAPDGFEYKLGDRLLRFIDTPGHARHHFCIYDARSRGIFSGDSFGLSYREFDTAKRGAFIVPTTTPVQFDPQAFHRTLERLMALEPKKMFLTHFGCVENPQALAPALHQQIDEFVQLTLSVADSGGNKYAQLTQHMRDAVWARLQAHGSRVTKKTSMELMAMDIDLNAQGLLYWLEHSRPAHG